MPSEVKVVFGAAGFATADNALTAGVSTTNDKGVITGILNSLKLHGVNQLDTARTYAEGQSEAALAGVEYEKLGFKLDTKVRSFFPGAHAPDKVRLSIDESLQALNGGKVNIMYLHAPDSTTPFEETVRVINDSYKKGEFKQFGLSNYSAEQVEQIVQICKKNDWVLPTVYQGMYNLVARNGEDKLFPVLRKYNISFYAYSPLAGSFLIDQAHPTDPQGRFDPNALLGQMYRGHFFKDSYFAGLEKLKAVAKKHGLTVSEVALRWLNHHSLLKRSHDDGIVMGGKTPSNIETTLTNLDKPALPKEVVDVVEQVWQEIKADAPAYHM